MSCAKRGILASTTQASVQLKTGEASSFPPDVSITVSCTCLLIGYSKVMLVQRASSDVTVETRIS